MNIWTRKFNIAYPFVHVSSNNGFRHAGPFLDDAHTVVSFLIFFLSWSVRIILEILELKKRAIFKRAYLNNKINNEE